MTYLSPLRYPGGKAKLGPYFARLLSHQAIDVDTYCEPYAGGAGAGLHLLIEGHVNRLIINDLNPGVAAFWRAALRRPSAFNKMIETCDVSMENWHRQRAVYLAPEEDDDLRLGFATFFLNRCNRSGILSARPIGGLDQTGQWKIGARFNKPALMARIDALQHHAGQINVHEEPATALIAKLNRRTKPVFMYVDPPYVVQGEELYMRSHNWNDHARLATLLHRTAHPWVLTYDVDERVRALYPDVRCLRFGISHTAQKQKIGNEFMFFSRGLRVPDLQVLPSHEGAWIA